MKDDNGTVWYYKVLEWMLPKFSEEEGGKLTLTLFEWQAARMNNYLKWLLIKDLNAGERRFKLHYFAPLVEDKSKRKVIEAHHVARLYGIMMARTQHDGSMVD